MVPVCGEFESRAGGARATADRQEMLHSTAARSPPWRALTREAIASRPAELLHRGAEGDPRLDDARSGRRPAGRAGVIHTDFETGFIRAEIYTLKDLEELETEAAIKAAGKLRAEGKAYVMKDGDVCHFLFNV